MSAKADKLRKLRSILLQVGLFLLVFVLFRAWQTRDAVEGIAPELEGTGVHGEALALAGTTEPTVVHFWATWCGVCAAEEGTIDALADDHRVITVAAQSGDANNVLSYFEQRDVDFPTLVDPSGDIAHAWGVQAFPTTFVIDPDGSIRHVEVGYTTSLGLRARLFLARVL